MRTIAIVAVIGVLLLQLISAIPQESVGGSLTIAFVFLLAALAVGIQEAWAKGRGVLGWIVNIFASLVGALMGAQAGGFVLVTLIGSVMELDGSIARTGGVAMSAALVGAMLATLFGAWAALWLVNRLRREPKAA